MDFTPTEEQKMLADSAERYIRDKYTFEERRKFKDTSGGFSREHWSRFAEMGWLALPVPEEYGGLGSDISDVAQLMERFGYGLVVEPFVDCAILCTTIIGRANDTTLRGQLLEQIITGERIVALAHQEVTSRNEFDFNIKTQATQSGDRWSITGTKHRVFYGEGCDAMLVTAESEGEIHVFVVDRDADGVVATSYELLDGTRGADIKFDHAPAILLVSGHNPSINALEEGFDNAILAMSSAAIGSMEAVMELTSEYLKTRVQYGKPLAQFQALQHRMSEMFVETDQSRAMLSGAIAAAQGSDVSKRKLMVSELKYLVSGALYFVTGQGIQLHGGIGTTEEYAVGHHYKGALMYEKRFGDAGFHLERSSTDVVRQKPLGGAFDA